MPRKKRQNRDGISILDVHAAKGRKEGRRWLYRVRDPRAKRYVSAVFDSDSIKDEGRTIPGCEDGDTWAKDERARFTLGISSARPASLTVVGKAYLEELTRRGRCERHRADVGNVIAEAIAHGLDDLKDDDFKGRTRSWLTRASWVPHRQKNRVSEDGEPIPTKARALSARSRNKRLVILRGAVRFALGEGWLPVDILAGVKAETDRSTTKLRDVFSGDELRSMVSGQHRKDPYWLNAVCLTYLGLRLGELHALRWSWFDWKGKVVNIRQEADFSPKRHQERSIPLQPELIEILKPLQLKGPIPLHQCDTAPGRTRAFASYLGRLKLDSKGRGAHCVRHSWVSLRLALGIPSLVVQQQVGHRTILTTEKYAHAVPAGWIEGWPKDGTGEFYLRRALPVKKTNAANGLTGSGRGAMR